MYPHLMAEEVDAFVADRLPPSRSRDLAIHLLGCAECAEAFHRLHPNRGADRLAEFLGLPEPAPTEPSELTRCALEIAENDQGLALWQELSHLPANHKDLRLRNLTQSQVTPGLIMAILHDSRRLWHESALEAGDLARRALELVKRLQAGGYPLRSLLVDLRAQSLGYLGNAERIQGDLRSAERKLQLGLLLVLQGGSGDVALIGLLVRLWAKVRRDAEDFSQAHSLYNLAEACFETVNDQEWMGIMRLDKALLQAEQGHVEQATEKLRTLIRADYFPKMSILAQLSATQQLAFRLCEIGEFFEARKLLPEVDRLAGVVGGSLNQLKVKWLKARVAAGSRNKRAAERRYSEVRDRLVEIEHSMDAALVTLELAELYLAWGRSQEAREQAAVVLEVCRSLEGLRREELEAIATLVQAEEDCLERALSSLRSLLDRTPSRADIRR